MITAIQGFNQNVQQIGDWLEKAAYWMDPRNAHKELWTWADATIKSPETAYYMMGGTMIGVVLISMGAQWPKKPIFWGWITYWILKAMVFR